MIQHTREIDIVNIGKVSFTLHGEDVFSLKLRVDHICDDELTEQRIEQLKPILMTAKNMIMREIEDGMFNG